MNRLVIFLILLAAACVQIVHAQSVGVVDEVNRYAQSEPGGSFELQSRSLFEYDGQYAVQSTDEVWTGQAWAGESRTTYSGNRFNMETGSSVWNAVSASWEPVDQTTIDWFYDLFTGQVMAPAAETYATWDGASFVNETRTVYTYDGNAVIEMEQTDTWNGGTWIPTERELYTEENSQVIVTTQEYDGTAWNNKERVTWPFATRAEFQEFALELAQASVHYDGLLLSLASLPVTTTDTWTGTEWMPASRGNALYDLFTGYRVGVTEEEFDGQAWTAVSRMSFAYNESGQMTGLTFEIADGPESWTGWQSDTYTWNDKNDLASISSEYFPGTEFAFLARTDLTWRYFSVDTEPEEHPVSHELISAWPNPFNPSVQIAYTVASAGDVTVAVFDQLGRRVATLHDGFQATGEHRTTFRADHLPSGNYIVRMTTPAGQSARLVTLLK